jgi:hypothetical protein
MMTYYLTQHAQKEMLRRGITDGQVAKVLASPEAIIPEKYGCHAYQALLHFDSEQPYMVRVIVDTSKNPLTVITVYRSSKIEKYRSLSS